MLWITPDLFEIEVDGTYSEARRYLENEPSMQTQGDRQDMLSSMAEDMIQDFNNKEHFRKVFTDGLNVERRTAASRIRSCGSLIFGCPQDQITNAEFRAANEDFKDLLGFREGEETTSKKWPVLAPVLYNGGQTHNAYRAFRSTYIKNVG
ncbi:hypothetical protein CTheo_9234 [Ceratobasidium theobromae]|uniref:Uncharacterized protein n=1 Tax=Ceratobasidium theobromae TaxID=1582974 RepID=A0A5N5Q5N0_9AGAM|nr:hypothetical protein CTheo_9234 [Ceratobasidium theobromae]